MVRQPLKAVNIISVGYNPVSQTLEIEFHDGSIIQYYDLPNFVYQALISAELPDMYYEQNIKSTYHKMKLA